MTERNAEKPVRMTLAELARVEVTQRELRLLIREGVLPGVLRVADGVLVCREALHLEDKKKRGGGE